MRGECKEDKGLPLLPLSTFPSTSTQDNPEPEETRSEKCKKHIILSSLFMAYVLVSAAYSIIAPFYPQEVGIIVTDHAIKKVIVHAMIVTCDS